VILSIKDFDGFHIFAMLWPAALLFGFDGSAVGGYNFTPFVLLSLLIPDFERRYRCDGGHEKKLGVEEVCGRESGQRGRGGLAGCM
jgi:hypothetical protein